MSQNILYQVSYDISDDKTRKRELGAFEYYASPDRKGETVIDAFYFDDSRYNKRYFILKWLD